MAKRIDKSVTERPADMAEVKDYGHGKFTEDVGGNRTIYVQSNLLWAEMVAYAKSQGLSNSETISRAIRAYISANKDCPVCARAREIYMVGAMPVKRETKKRK
jgi:hypothetical protein